MKKFIVIYHASKESMEDKRDINPEDAKKGMEAWKIWAEKCGEGLVDMGAPLGNGQKVSSDGASESEKNVVGYSILQAESMDEAKEMLKDHPHLKWTEDCEIEVHEALPMPGSE